VLKPITVVLLTNSLVCTVSPEVGQGVPAMTVVVRLAGAVDETGTAREVKADWSMGVLMTATDDVSTGEETQVAARTLETEKSVRSARDLKGAILRC
jgi:hypothetical protein